jgi:hypothetical protein
MSEPAQTVRLHIHLCDGLSGLSRVIDRLAAIGIVPLKLCFRRGRNGRAIAHVDLGPSDRVAAEQLRERLVQLVPVVAIRLTFR